MGFRKKLVSDSSVQFVLDRYNEMPHSSPMNFESERPSESSRSRNCFWVLLTATAINCALQSIRFWRLRAHEITLDGINYVGLARHLVDGDVKASLHAYWSPLTSWLIAACGLFSRNFTFMGKLVTLGSFLVSLVFLYLLTLRLWQSRVAAALAVFWFSAARGIVFTAAGSVLADFVLTACVLFYFIVLWSVLRGDRPGSWLLLGAAHALAFFGKAIAMPWLSIATVLAALIRNLLIRNLRSPRRMVAALALAFLFPATVWAGWGLALKTKYGVFTTGYQLRANLLINWQRRLSHYPRGNDLKFVDTSSEYDNYMVGEQPWSEVRRFQVLNAALLPMIADSEVHYLPQAVKELAILLTPAGVLAVLLMLVLLWQHRMQYQTEAAFACIVLVSAVCLVLAYCMLFFDARYVIPVTPMLIAVGCPALLPADMAGRAPHAPAWLRNTLIGIFVASTVFFAVYWASPLRTVDRDFAASCEQAATVLRNQKSGRTLVSIGNGPYPEHGVGFEAGSYVAFLAGWRLVGENLALPDDSAQAEELVRNALAPESDAIVVWGSPSSNRGYGPIVEEIKQVTSLASVRTLTDPNKGEVGTLILKKN
jgi:hypothetical protein